MNFSKNFSHRLGAIFFLGFTILAHGSVSDAQLQKEYGGKILTVRQFYPGYHLRFDATGKLDNPVAPGAWTVDGQVQVKTVSLKDGVVHIVGRRLWLFFDTESKQLRDVGSLPKYDTAMKRFNTKNVDEWAREEGRVEIEVECGVTHPKKTDLIKAMNAVFLADNGAAALRRTLTAGKRPDTRQRCIPVLQETLENRESREVEQRWMISLTQGRFGSEQVRRAIGDALSQEDVSKLLTCIRNEPLKYRNRAVAVLSYHRHIRVGHVARFLGVSHSSVDNWVGRFSQHGCQLLLPFTSQYCKAKDTTYRDSVFEILHAPPSAHRINRTTWRLRDIQSVMEKRGLPIARSNIRKIIKNAGYRYRKAEKVLTSTDPNYKDKLRKIAGILHNHYCPAKCRRESVG